MKISAIVDFLNLLAPPAYQEHYDNAGLLTGTPSWECRGVLATLDVTEGVVEEAAARGCNLVVAHHPIIFKGLKRLTGSSYVERTVIAAIKRDIAIYAIHTNLDHIVAGGVNGRIAGKLGIRGGTALLPKEGVLQKLYCFVPVDHLEAVRAALFAAGAGQIGGYSECSYAGEGMGTFKGGEGTNPFVGEPGVRHQEKEMRLEMILPAHMGGKIVAAMKAVHPYEEVAYDLVSLANPHPGVGAGLIGELPGAMEEREFLDHIGSVFGLSVIRHTPLTGRPVRRVAVCGGAGSFLISNALAVGADFLITGDVKYHEFFDADGRLVIADIGHFESEQFTIDLLFEVLQEKFGGEALREKNSNFAVLKSETKTNPVKYYRVGGAGSAEGLK